MIFFIFPPYGARFLFILQEKAILCKKQPRFSAAMKNYFGVRAAGLRPFGGMRTISLLWPLLQFMGALITLNRGFVLWVRQVFIEKGQKMSLLSDLPGFNVWIVIFPGPAALSAGRIISRLQEK